MGLKLASYDPESPKTEPTYVLTSSGVSDGVSQEAQARNLVSAVWDTGSRDCSIVGL